MAHITPDRNKTSDTDVDKVNPTSRRQIKPRSTTDENKSEEKPIDPALLSIGDPSGVA